MSFQDKNVREILRALQELESNPNHPYTAEQVNELLSLKKMFNAPIVEIREMGKTIRPIIEVASTLRSVYEIQKTVDAAVSAYSHIVKGFSTEFSERMAERGWLLGSTVFKAYSLEILRSMTALENITEFENMLIADAQTFVPKIVTDGVNRYPSRKSLFEEIQECYSKGLYHAVVLLCYSQADGICSEVFGVAFFDKDRTKDYQMKIKLDIEEKDLAIFPFFMQQFKIVDNEITAHSEGAFMKEKGTDTFNRHKVMHGHALDYGTKKNAVRAILLLDFILHLGSK